MDDLVVIHRPIQEVFAFVTDHSNDKYWKPFVTESRKITPGSIDVGTRFEIVVTTWGYRRSGEVEIVEHNPYQSFAYKAHDPIYSFIARNMFSETPSETQIRGQVEFQSTGVWKLSTPLFLLFIRTQLKQTFNRLKQVMEKLNTQIES